MKWRAVPSREGYFQDVDVLREDGLAVAVAVQNGDITPVEAAAHARLIAAAPDMLATLLDEDAALSELIRELAGRDGLRVILLHRRATIRAAIAKAEGQS